MTEEKITQLYVSVTDSISFLQSLQSQTALMHDSMYVHPLLDFQFIFHFMACQEVDGINQFEWLLTIVTVRTPSIIKRRSHQTWTPFIQVWNPLVPQSILSTSCLVCHLFLLFFF